MEIIRPPHNAEENKSYHVNTVYQICFGPLMPQRKLWQNNKACFGAHAAAWSLGTGVTCMYCMWHHTFSIRSLKAPGRVWRTAADEWDTLPWIYTHVLFAVIQWPCVWCGHVTVHLPSQHAVTVSTGAWSGQCWMGSSLSTVRWEKECANHSGHSHTEAGCY